MMPDKAFLMPPCFLSARPPSLSLKYPQTQFYVKKCKKLSPTQTLGVLKVSFIRRAFRLLPPLQTQNHTAMPVNTKNRWAKPLQYLTIFSVSAMVLLVCKETSFSREADGKKKAVIFKGNEIEMGQLKVIPYEYRRTWDLQKKMLLYTTLPDSVPIENWRTNEIKMVAVKSDIMPVAINSKPILGNEVQYVMPDANKKYTPPVFAEAGSNLEKYIFTKTADKLNQLEDGTYILRIDKLVIDENGNIAYYEPHGVETYMGSMDKLPAINEAINTSIKQEVTALLDGPVKFNPAMKDGKPVNVRMGLTNYAIEVKNHKAKLVGRGGC